MKVYQALPYSGDGWIHPPILSGSLPYNWRLGEIKVMVIPVTEAFSRLQLDRLPQLLISQIFLKVDGSC